MSKLVKQKTIREMIRTGEVVNLTFGRHRDYEALQEKEGGWEEVYYSAGIYGCNGRIFRGLNTKTLYGIGDRTPALWLFE